MEVIWIIQEFPLVVEIFTNPIDFIIFTTDIFTIEIKTALIPPPLLPSIGEGDPHEENDCKC